MLAACGALSNLALNNAANQAWLLRCGVVRLLSRLLGAKHPSLVEQSAHALASLVHGNAEAQAALLSAGTLPTAAAAVRGRNARSLRQCLRLLDNLCADNPAACAAAAAAGLLRDAHQLALSRSSAVAKHATSLLSHLASQQADCRAEVQSAGPSLLPRLVQLSCAKDKDLAARGLAALAAAVDGHAGNQALALQLRVPQIAAKHLGGADFRASGRAAAALAALTAGNPTGRQAALQAGTVPLLLGGLYSHRQHPSTLRSYVDALAAIGGPGALCKLLSSPSTVVAAQAATNLRRALAEDADGKARGAALSAGALPALASLLVRHGAVYTRDAAGATSLPASPAAAFSAAALEPVMASAVELLVSGGAEAVAALRADRGVGDTLAALVGDPNVTLALAAQELRALAGV